MYFDASRVRFAYGNYTTFGFDADAGEVSNFAVGGDLIFDSATVSDFAFEEEQVTGAVAVYDGADSQIFLHDNPMESSVRLCHKPCFDLAKKWKQVWIPNFQMILKVQSS